MTWNDYKQIVCGKIVSREIPFFHTVTDSLSMIHDSRSYVSNKYNFSVTKPIYLVTEVLKEK